MVTPLLLLSVGDVWLGRKRDMAFLIDKASEQRDAQKISKERTRLCLLYAWLDDPGP